MRSGRGHGRGQGRGHGWSHRHGVRFGEQGAPLTLDRVKRGSRVRVMRVRGGSRLIHRLAALGIVPGTLISVDRERGPAVVSLHGVRVAVGRGAAMAIEVEETPE
jgi:ferrous iron transport protein A